MAEIRVDSVDSNPFQARMEFDEVKIGELAESIGKVGLLQRVLVRPHPEVEGRYQLAHGERRLRAFIHLGRSTIPANVRELSDREMVETVVIENLQREDLNPLEEVMWAQYAENEFREDLSDYDRAKWLRNMRDRFGYTQESVGERAGLSKQRVNQLLRMLQLEGKVTAVTLSKMTERQARALLAAPEEDGPALVQYVELYLEERGTIPPASVIEEYAQALVHATERESRRLYETEEDADLLPYETGAEESPGTEEEYAEAVKVYIEEHDLGGVFDAEANGAGFLTKIEMLTEEELQFCLAHETRPLSIRRLNEESYRRDLKPLQVEPPLSPAAEDRIVAAINRMVGEPVEVLQGTLVEEHGLTEEEADAALQAYRETFPDIWSVCYPEKAEEPEEPMTAEQYVADVLMHSPEVGHEELARVTAKMFGVSEAHARGLIDRKGQKRGRKPRDLYGARTLCPLCGRGNAEKNRLLLVLEEYQATQPGVTLVDWLREVLA